MRTIQRALQKFNLHAPVQFDAPLSEYTTFRVGGPAEALVQPRTTQELTQLLVALANTSIPLTILGGGANVVVSDSGVSGVVVHTGGLIGIDGTGDVIIAGAGTAVSDVAARAADESRPGLEWIYAMPGSTGGAVWMNARCYGGEIAAVLAEVLYVTRDGVPGRYITDPTDFGYKVSPFQDGERIITEVRFSAPLQRGSAAALWERMHEIEEDRRGKGHFDAPCAGSIFKNDRRFGEPSGKIIDRVGLRGLRRGGAQVSSGHGNIIINTGTASAQDIRGLVTEVRDQVYRETGHLLDPEVLFLGDWT